MEFAEAIDTIAKTLREDSETRDAWKNATAGVLCDHQTDTPEQREAAAKAVLSLLFFGAEPNPWKVLVGPINGDALEHLASVY